MGIFQINNSRFNTIWCKSESVLFMCLIVPITLRVMSLNLE